MMGRTMTIVSGNGVGGGIVGLGGMSVEGVHDGGMVETVSLDSNRDVVHGIRHVLDVALAICNTSIGNHVNGVFGASGVVVEPLWMN